MYMEYRARYKYERVVIFHLSIFMGLSDVYVIVVSVVERGDTG